MDRVDQSEPVLPGAARRRFFRPRFSLWALLLLITVIAIPFSYVAQRRGWNLKRKAAWELLVAKGVYLPRDGIGARETLAGELTFWQWLIAEEPKLIVDYVWATCCSGEKQESTTFNASDLHLLSYFPEIEDLRLWGPCDAGDESLAFVAQLKMLRHLSIARFPKLRGTFLRNLHCENCLKEVELTSLDKLEGQHLPDFESFTKLDLLSLSECPLLNDETLRGVNLPSSIESLGVCGEIGDQTLSRWLKNGGIKYLALDTAMSRKSATFMQNQSELKSLQITNAPWIDEDFQFLSQCHKLAGLSCTSLPIEGELLDKFTQPESAHELHFCNTLFSDSNLTKLARFESLGELDLSWTPLTGAGFKPLVSLPENCQLKLTGTRFTREGKTALAHFKPLYSLNGVCLPANWTAEDMHQLDNATQEWQYFLPADAAVDTKKLFGEYLSFYIANDQSWLAGGKFDRCPPGLMAPVVRLHELARQAETRKSEIDVMIKEEGHIRLFDDRGKVIAGEGEIDAAE